MARIVAASTTPSVQRLGRADYHDTWQAMKAFTEKRAAGTPDAFWLVEHPPVYTVGIAGRDEHLPKTASDIPVVRTDRGGQITYHGPGQIVVYTLVDLRRLELTVRGLVRRLENAVVDLLGEHGVTATGDPARPGVYVGHAKIAALGLKIRGGCSYHGLAFNIDMDLAPFAAIDPCGYPGLAVTDARREGVKASLAALADRLVERVQAHLYQ
ncbi:MAG: lipoyl(octanoyl) transferase LipB [Burkholderiales bacterium]